MTVVVPMAGHSRRFQARGYKVPKAFIEIDGKPMIHWVCGMFSPEDHFVFVTLKDYMAVPEYKETLQSAAVSCDIVEIDSHEKGPIYTALFADQVIDDSEPVVMTYCDFYQHWDYQQFLMKMVEYEGGIAVFRGFQHYMVGTPASFGDTFYAYLKADENFEMLELREKQSFTDIRHYEFASTGVYYLAKWQLYKKWANYLLEKGISVGQEYYISLIYNLIVQNGGRVGLFEVDKFICWGTPEDLEEYFFWSEFFSKDINSIRQRDAL